MENTDSNQTMLSDAKADQLIASLNKSSKLASQNLTFRWNLLRGLYSGLGATLGIAILFALASYVIKSLGGLPVIGTLLIRLGSYLHQ